MDASMIAAYELGTRYAWKVHSWYHSSIPLLIAHLKTIISYRLKR